MKIKLTIILITVLCCKLVAQPPAVKLLAKSNSIIDSSQYFSVDILIKVIAGGLQGELLEKTTGTLKRAGNDSYSELGPLITINRQNQSVVIDTENSEILLSKNQNNSSRQNYFDIYKQLAPYIDSIYVSSSNDSSIFISCKYNKKFGVIYDKIDFILDKNTYLPKKMLMYPLAAMPVYDEELKGRKLVLIIEYNNWVLNIKPLSSFFDINNYVTKNGGVWQPVKKYEGFELSIID